MEYAPYVLSFCEKQEVALLVGSQK
jgi:hypothetical protein